MVPVKFLTEESEYQNGEEYVGDDTTAFIFNNGTLEELPFWVEANVLCQANPLGVDW